MMRPYVSYRRTGSIRRRHPSNSGVSAGSRTTVASHASACACACACAGNIQAAPQDCLVRSSSNLATCSSCMLRGVIFAAAPQPADPVGIALVSIFGGAALTALAGLFGAWLQGRREHRRWVRERRYEAFVAAEAVFSQLGFIDVRLKRFSDAGDKRSFDALVRERDEFVTKTVGAVIAPLELLGPQSVADAQMAYVRLDVSVDEETKSAAGTAVTEAMRNSLRVSLPRRPRWRRSAKTPPDA